MGGFSAGLAQGLQHAEDRALQSAQLKMQQDLAKYQQKAMETEDQMKQMNMQALMKKLAFQEQLPAQMAAVSGSQAGPLGAGQEGPQAPQEINRSHLASFLASASQHGQDPNQLLELMSLGDPRIADIKDSLRPTETKIVPAEGTLVELNYRNRPQPQAAQPAPAPAPVAQPAAAPAPTEDPAKAYQANLETNQAVEQGRNTGAGDTPIDFIAASQRNPPPADWGTGGIPQPQAAQAAPPAPVPPAAAPPAPPPPTGPQVSVLAHGGHRGGQNPMNVSPGSAVWDPVTKQVMFTNPTASGKPNDFGDAMETAAATYSKLIYGKQMTMQELINEDPTAAEKLRKQVKVVEPTIVSAGKIASGIPEHMKEPLNPEEANKLGVPYGTTKEQAKGIMPLTSVQREALASYDTARVLIQDIKTYSEKVNTAKGGWQGRGEQASKLWGAWTQSDPDAAMLQSKAGELARLARSMGEKGAMAEGDIARAAALVPGIMDTKEVAAQKLKDLSSLITGAEAAYNKSLGIYRSPNEKGAKDFRPATPKESTDAQIPVPKNLSPKQQEIFKQEYLKQRQKVQKDMQKGQTNAEQPQ